MYECADDLLRLRENIPEVVNLFGLSVTLPSSLRQEPFLESDARTMIAPFHDAQNNRASLVSGEYSRNHSANQSVSSLAPSLPLDMNKHFSPALTSLTSHTSSHANVRSTPRRNDSPSRLRIDIVNNPNEEVMSPMFPTHDDNL